jgi:hypothetical protein
MTGNQHYESAGVSYQQFNLNLSNLAAQPFGSSVKVDYNAASDSYTVTAPSGITQTFAPANIVVSRSNSSLTYYDKTTGGFRDILQLIIPPVKGVNLSYTLIGTWSHTDTTNGLTQGHIAVGGVPTIASDMPRTGTAAYDVDGSGAYITGNATLYGGALSDSTFSANFATGTLSTTLHMVGTPQAGGAAVDFGTATGSGSITSGTSAFTGTLSLADRTGAFAGSFFGPQALEMGYAWYLKGPAFAADGVLVGIKK